MIFMNDTLIQAIHGLPIRVYGHHTYDGHFKKEIEYLKKIDSLELIHLYYTDCFTL